MRALRWVNEGVPVWAYRRGKRTRAERRRRENIKHDTKRSAVLYLTGWCVSCDRSWEMSSGEDKGRQWVLRLPLTVSGIMLAADGHADDDPGPSNPTPRDTKHPVPTTNSTPLDQTTQEHTEAASVQSVPVGHVSALHSPPQRPSSARSPPSDIYATHPDLLHTQSSSVTVDPPSDRLSRRRSTLEVKSRVLLYPKR